MLHISYEAGDLEDLTVNGVELVDFGMGVSPEEAPDQSESVTVGFTSGVPTSLNGSSVGALEMVEGLNQIAGRNGVGRIDMVENRFVGMKSRGVYESPGMTVLYNALMNVEQLTMDRDLMHLRDRMSPEVAEMVYYGFWYTPKMDALMAFIREAQKPVTGEVTLKLYKGNITVDSKASPNSLYDAEIRHDGRRRILQPGRRRRVSTHPGTTEQSSGNGSSENVLVEVSIESYGQLS